MNDQRNSSFRWRTVNNVKYVQTNIGVSTRHKTANLILMSTKMSIPIGNQKYTCGADDTDFRAYRQ